MSRRRISRRTFVAATGTTGTLLVAGCADDPLDDENDTDGEDDTIGGDGIGDGDETYTLTVTVEDEEGPIEGTTVMVTADGMTDGNTTDDGNETDDGLPGEDNLTDDNATDGNDTDGNETDTTGTDEWEEETDSDGVAEFTDLEDGEYTVSAEGDAGEAEETVEIQGADEELTLTLE